MEPSPRHPVADVIIHVIDGLIFLAFMGMVIGGCLRCSGLI